ncbi:hypothetical protein JOE30_001726 [Rhodococcus sp. PvP016]|uniref:Uncharacterized protein n=1 Tax=Rhodococcoides corynebacterioides TaxID=53972 RepID=A0ABS2KNZ0_9NOCA|nr:hypothetical protein [Rhodococcus corynebacterioides]MBP1115929.1 hypothetical protein [Rhodococcus sp. PvP016]
MMQYLFLVGAILLAFVALLGVLRSGLAPGVAYGI